MVAGAWLPQEALRAGLGARFFVADVSAALCPRLLGGRGLELELCAGMLLSVWRVRGLGLDENLSRVQPGMDATAELRLVVPRGPLVWAFTVAADQPIAGPRFSFTDSQRAVVEVHRRSGVAGRAGLELAWKFR
jgi:hypothetical protein